MYNKNKGPASQANRSSLSHLQSNPATINTNLPTLVHLIQKNPYQFISPTVFVRTEYRCANQPPATPAVRLVPPIPSLNPPIIKAQHHHPNSFTRDLTIPAGGVTWFGCGSHIPSVLDSIPENQRCGCGPQIERSGKMYPPGGKNLSLW
jgi:hypothetical protein